MKKLANTARCRRSTNASPVSRAGHPAPFGLRTKDLPKSYLKPHWRSLFAVAKKLAAIRHSKIVDIVMDRKTRQTIVKGFIADNRKIFEVIPAPVTKLAALGMDYVTITMGGIKMCLVWHAWFDSMRVASLERGLRIRALTLDFSDCWTDSGVPIFKKRNHHRILVFK